MKLPDQVRNDVATGALSMGHARALLAIERDDALERAAREVLDQKLSVRETEALAKKANEPAPVEPAAAGVGTDVEAVAEPTDVHTRQAEETMRVSLGTRVHIRRKGKGGRIEIEFVSEDELHRLTSTSRRDDEYQ